MPLEQHEKYAIKSGIHDRDKYIQMKIAGCVYPLGYGTTTLPSSSTSETLKGKSQTSISKL